MKLFNILIIAISALLYGCQDNRISHPNRVVSLSISSDARYILSCHKNHDLILWNRMRRNAARVAKKVNCFSISFLQDKSEFIWQLQNGTDIYMHTIDNRIKKILNPGFQVYGEVLSNDKQHYFGSDKQFNLYHIINHRSRVIKPAENGPGFHDVGKWLNLSLSSDQKYLLSSAMGNSQNDQTLKKNERESLLEDTAKRIKFSNWCGVMLWNARTGRAIHQLGGNISKTHAIFSPNGEYIIAGDENSNVFIWSMKTGEQLYRLDSLFNRRSLCQSKGDTFFLTKKSHVMLYPKDFCDVRVKAKCFKHERTNAIRYISKSAFFRFIEGIEYVLLYKENSPFPEKYFSLKNRSADVFGFNGGLRIVSSPSTHHLVMASTRTEGILIFQFVPKGKSLQLIWAPDNYHQFI